MKLFSKIKALFTMKVKQQQMDLTSAEVRAGGVFLHPTEDPNHTFCVKANEVDIIIKPGAEITEEDIHILDNKETPIEDEPLCEEKSAEEIAPDPQSSPECEPEDEQSANEEAPQEKICLEPINPENTLSEAQPRPVSQFMPQKKCFSFMLYPDEHERITRLIKENGYRKVEYFLACVESVKKTSMEANYKRFTEDRAQRYQADLAEAKRAQEEEVKKQQAESKRSVE